MTRRGAASGLLRRRVGGWPRARAVWAAAVLAGTLGATSAAAAAAGSIDQLHAFLTQTTSARGDFRQQSPGPHRTASGGAPTTAAALVSHGDFEFLRPGRFRWTYHTPYEQLIVSDGEHLFLYDQDLKQVTRKKLAGTLPASPASILFGANDLERNFRVVDDGSSDGIDWIRATPKDKGVLFELIRIGFRAGMPVAMQLRDSFGQTTDLVFDHLQRNPVLAPERFQYTPPPGVDVLDEQ